MTINSIPCGKILTVVIRDDGPMFHCDDSPAYRSVQIELTEEQRERLKLYESHSSAGTHYYEHVSKCFIEPEMP
jgi:hypothetical protein